MLCQWVSSERLHLYDCKVVSCGLSVSVSVWGSPGLWSVCCQPKLRCRQQPRPSTPVVFQLLSGHFYIRPLQARLTCGGLSERVPISQWESLLDITVHQIKVNILYFLVSGVWWSSTVMFNLIELVIKNSSWMLVVCFTLSAPVSRSLWYQICRIVILKLNIISPESADTPCKKEIFQMPFLSVAYIPVKSVKY